MQGTHIMTKDTKSNTPNPTNGSPTTPTHEEHIAPADFTPMTGEVKRSGITLSPLKIIVGTALFVSLLVLWFLLSAKSVVLQIEPETAQVTIDGGFTFELADHYLIRPGKYQVTATDEGYVELQTSFLVTEDDHQLLPLALTKKPGHLQVTSNPENAEIWVDGGLVGTSPITVYPLSPGEHQLAIKSPRYVAHTTSVTIEGLDKKQDLHHDLKPNWGYVAITTSPTGANVSINGEVQGKTPLTAEVLSEGETVDISLSGYKSWKKSFVVSAGETLVAPEITLEPADGVIELSSTPSGATVTVNGEYRGTTPITLDELVALSVKTTGNDDGIRVRIARRDTARAGVQQELMDRLSEAGLTGDSVLLIKKYVP